MCEEAFGEDGDVVCVGLCLRRQGVGMVCEEAGGIVRMC